MFEILKTIFFWFFEDCRIDYLDFENGDPMPGFMFLFLVFALIFACILCFSKKLRDKFF